MANTPLIERLFDGNPIISPRGDGWDSGVTFNSSAILVTDPSVVEALTGEPADRYPDGVVALHYRARPKTDVGYHWTRSYVGLSVHHPDLRFIRRFDDPVLSPGLNPTDRDYLGQEDPRITYLDGRYWLVACGCVFPEPGQWLGTMMVSVSDDLVNWQKLGPVRGIEHPKDAVREPYGTSNKDGAIFSERIDGKVFLLHRPMTGPLSEYSVRIASADAPDGVFTDHGPLYVSNPTEGAIDSWVGAGGVPIPLGDGRYLMVGHTGNSLPGDKRLYVLDAVILDFKRFDPDCPERIVVSRIDGVMRPETKLEVEGPFPDSVANVVFACGNYVHDGWLYLVYGGGDTFTLGARVRLDALLDALERSPV